MLWVWVVRMGFSIAKGMEFELINYGALERSIMGSVQRLQQAWFHRECVTLGVQGYALTAFPHLPFLCILLLWPSEALGYLVGL